MKKHLCCDCGVMLEKRRGGWGRVGRCLWSLNWHSQTSVVLYLSHPSDSNSYTLRCLYILTLGLQGHNLKRYPVKNVEKYKIKIDMFGGKANEGKGQNTRKRTQWNHSPKDSRSLTTERNQMLRPCRIPSFALKRFKQILFVSQFVFGIWLVKSFYLKLQPSFFLTPLPKVTQEWSVTAKPRVVTAASPPYGTEGKSHEDGKNKDKVSLLIQPFSLVFLWFPSPATAFFFVVWSLEMHYLSHPCHIQGNTLRGFDILTATEDGHNLQRHSTQADRQAGIAKAKQ